MRALELLGKGLGWALLLYMAGRIPALWLRDLSFERRRRSFIRRCIARHAQRWPTPPDHYQPIPDDQIPY